MSSSVSSSKFNWHVFRKSKHLKMQENFIFLDTEANIHKIHKKLKNLTFKMGCGIIWNRKDDNVIKFPFYDVSHFWNEVNDAFDDNHKQYILFAHNAHFDMKMVNGFNQLRELGWENINHYVRNKTYILLFKKGNYILHIWDTTNYVPNRLEEIGEVVGFPKLEVDFDSCTKEELEIYCMRDVEILYEFIKNIINFNIENDLTRLKATASSLSFNAYRHRFYKPEENKIWIHDFKRAILLERCSYRGGITDVFRFGKAKNLHKIDINSQYPKAMRDMKIPTKLLLYTHECDKRLLDYDDIDCNIDDLTKKDYDKISLKLMNIYDKCKKDYGIIAKCSVYIPKRYAYILNDYGLGKTSFAWGKVKITLCSPELKFIEQFGKILKIHEINVYEVKQIFKEFVDFFYDLKAKYDKEGNLVFRALTKLYLNGFYGKWGQKEFITEKMDYSHKYLIENQDFILDLLLEKKDLIQNSAFVYIGSINSKELYVIDNKLYLSYNTSNNSKESFVAISSFITSRARMDLVKYLMIVKRKNCWYGDTDSLFVNEKGFKKLVDKRLIDDHKLGLLKEEGFGNGQFYNPKFYDFENLRATKDKDKGIKRKCKGISGIKDGKAKVLDENVFFVKYRVKQWDKFKKDMKEGNFENQYIRVIEKTMSKIYDKGIVGKNGYIEPYHISQIKNSM